MCLVTRSDLRWLCEWTPLWMNGQYVFHTSVLSIDNKVLFSWLNGPFSPVYLLVCSGGFERSRRCSLRGEDMRAITRVSDFELKLLI